MQTIIDICNRAKQLNENSLLIELFQSNEFRLFLIETNKNQLYRFGIDNNEKKLKSDYARFGQVYADSTINRKQSLGQPTDRVTLKDTGDFYNSFEVLNIDNTLIIASETISYTDKLVENFGLDILGLTAENSAIAIDLAREIIIPIIINKLLDV